MGNVETLCIHFIFLVYLYTQTTTTCWWNWKLQSGGPTNQESVFTTKPDDAVILQLSNKESLETEL